MTVRELLVRIDADELLDWQAFEQEYGPLPDRRADYHAAQIEAALLNVNRGKHDKAVSVNDRLLRFHGPERASEVETPTVGKVRREPEPEWKKSKRMFLAWAREDAKATRRPRTSKIRKKKPPETQGPQ